MRTIFKRLLILSMAALVAGVAYGSYQFWTTATPDQKTAVLGGFSGSFFAFLFVIIAAIASKVYARRLKDHSGIVRLQHLLNEAGSFIDINIRQIDKYSDAVTRIPDHERQVTFFFGRFSDLPMNKEVLLNLWNVDLINEAFLFMHRSQRVNNDIKSLKTSYDDFRAGYMAGNITRENFTDNAEALQREFRSLKTYLEHLASECTRLIAMTRVLLRSKHLIGRIAKIFTAQRLSTCQENLIDAEIQNLNREMDESGAKSRQRIEEIDSRTPNS